jgi:hypothetical protein
MTDLLDDLAKPGRRGQAWRQYTRSGRRAGGLLGLRSMRDPNAVNPVPKGVALRHTARSKHTGLLGHLAKSPGHGQAAGPRATTTARGLDRTDIPRCSPASALTGPGGYPLMLSSGLRSAEGNGPRVPTSISGGLGAGSGSGRPPKLALFRSMLWSSPPPLAPVRNLNNAHRRGCPEDLVAPRGAAVMQQSWR